MKPEYDFSKGERGKFFRPNTELRLPIYLNADVQAYLIERAAQKGQVEPGREASIRKSDERATSFAWALHVRVTHGKRIREGRSLDARWPSVPSAQRLRGVAYTSIHETLEHPAVPCPPPGMRST